MTDMATSRTAAVRRGLYLLPRRSVIFLIELYRTWVSPLRLPTCRFEPTCSGYAVEALETHGFLRGGTLAVVRLLKCGPWHKPGYDPVPERGFRWLPTGSADVERRGPDHQTADSPTAEQPAREPIMEVRGN